MASTVRQDRILKNVWVKPDASKSSKKGLGLAGRKPLGDLSNAVKNQSSSASLNQTSKKASVSVGGKASRNRKVLSDISNSAKLQKETTSKKTLVKECLSVVCEEQPLAGECGIAEEGFLHNHDECIKAQTQAMDVDEFMKIISMENDCSTKFGSPRVVATPTRFDPESPERNYKLLTDEGSQDFKLSPAGRLDSSPSWSPPSSPELDIGWMDSGSDDIFNFKLIDFPLSCWSLKHCSSILLVG